MFQRSLVLPGPALDQVPTRMTVQRELLDWIPGIQGRCLFEAGRLMLSQLHQV
jgi:hypothetical protein